jgi:hypothetical protein
MTGNDWLGGQDLGICRLKTRDGEDGRIEFYWDELTPKETDEVLGHYAQEVSSS